MLLPEPEPELEPEAAEEGVPVISPWAVGALVDIQSEGGWERGAVILGPSTTGSPEQMRVRFADGVVDDWDVDEFVAAAAAAPATLDLVSLPAKIDPADNPFRRQEKDAKLQKAYRAGALSRSLYERLVAQAGGTPGPAVQSRLDADTTAAILAAKLGALDVAVKAGELDHKAYQVARTKLGAAPARTPTFRSGPLPGEIEGKDEWNRTLRLLNEATQDFEDPPQASVLIGLEEGAKTATPDTCERCAQWLCVRFDEIPESANVKLKVILVLHTLATYGSAVMCRELAKACLAPAEAAMHFQCRSHTYHGNKPMNLVRSNAKDCVALLKSAEVRSAVGDYRAEQQHAIAMDGRKFTGSLFCCCA
jgi:hypothetical protein